ncbi:MULTISPECIES: hypothetical protein [unclassified Brenneria]|uniref:hypothetical protein n=1 Tax=unclassified Brenneria TaxID=2634434 RepID=UPI0018F0FC52|nr:hypothetical protein [Brenneria sp. L3-3C-1]MBJ7223502.1 hypothetical protein [Brenneria sp. L3-3C-1]MEE3644743.1 hypothetical protein [Brenneria sp. L3_3C_1]
MLDNGAQPVFPLHPSKQIPLLTECWNGQELLRSNPHRTFRNSGKYSFRHAHTALETGNTSFAGMNHRAHLPAGI